MKKVYIAHPLRGNVEKNMTEATQICRQLTQQPGIVPLSPLHNFSYLDADNYSAYHAMQMCFGLLACADEIWVYGNWSQSEGCRAEVAFARCHGISIRFMDSANQTA